MNKTISFPLVIIIIICAVLVGGLVIWQYFEMPKEDKVLEEIPETKQPEERTAMQADQVINANDFLPSEEIDPITNKNIYRGIIIGKVVKKERFVDFNCSIRGLLEVYSLYEDINKFFVDILDVLQKASLSDLKTGVFVEVFGGEKGGCCGYTLIGNPEKIIIRTQFESSDLTLYKGKLGEYGEGGLVFYPYPNQGLTLIKDDYHQGPWILVTADEYITRPPEGLSLGDEIIVKGRQICYSNISIPCIIIKDEITAGPEI